MKPDIYKAEVPDRSFDTVAKCGEIADKWSSNMEDVIGQGLPVSIHFVKNNCRQASLINIIVKKFESMTNGLISYIGLLCPKLNVICGVIVTALQCMPILIDKGIYQSLKAAPREKTFSSILFISWLTQRSDYYAKRGASLTDAACKPINLNDINVLIKDRLTGYDSTNEKNNLYGYVNMGKIYKEFYSPDSLEKVQNLTNAVNAADLKIYDDYNKNKDCRLLKDRLKAPLTLCIYSFIMGHPRFILDYLSCSLPLPSSGIILNPYNWYIWYDYVIKCLEFVINQVLTELILSPENILHEYIKMALFGPIGLGENGEVNPLRNLFDDFIKTKREEYKNSTDTVFKADMAKDTKKITNIVTESFNHIMELFKWTGDFDPTKENLTILILRRYVDQDDQTSDLDYLKARLTSDVPVGLPMEKKDYTEKIQNLINELQKSNQKPLTLALLKRKFILTAQGKIKIREFDDRTLDQGDLLENLKNLKSGIFEIISEQQIDDFKEYTWKNWLSALEEFKPIDKFSLVEGQAAFQSTGEIFNENVYSMWGEFTPLKQASTFRLDKFNRWTDNGWFNSISAGISSSFGWVVKYPYKWFYKTEYKVDWTVNEINFFVGEKREGAVTFNGKPFEPFSATDTNFLKDNGNFIWKDDKGTINLLGTREDSAWTKWIPKWLLSEEKEDVKLTAKYKVTDLFRTTLMPQLLHLSDSQSLSDNLTKYYEKIPATNYWLFRPDYVYLNRNNKEMLTTWMDTLKSFPYQRVNFPYLPTLLENYIPNFNYDTKDESITFTEKIVEVL
jgi:hypothetical protein